MQKFDPDRYIADWGYRPPVATDAYVSDWAIAAAQRRCPAPLPFERSASSPYALAIPAGSFLCDTCPRAYRRDCSQGEGWCCAAFRLSESESCPRGAAGRELVGSLSRRAIYRYRPEEMRAAAQRRPDPQAPGYAAWVSDTERGVVASVPVPVGVMLGPWTGSAKPKI
jgi:hypothetical protein